MYDIPVGINPIESNNLGVKNPYHFIVDAWGSTFSIESGSVSRCVYVILKTVSSRSSFCLFDLTGFQFYRAFFGDCWTNYFGIF